MKHPIPSYRRAWFPVFTFFLLMTLLSLGTPNSLQAASAGPATKLIVLKRGDILDEHSPAMEYSKVDFESAFALKVILPTGQTVTVPKNQLGLVFSYPEPNAVLDSPSDSQALTAKRTEALALAAKYPKAKPYMDRVVAQIDADLAKLATGQVRYRGVWQARSAPSGSSPAANGMAINGVTYKGVAVTRIDNGTVSISHDGGIARIPLADATPELLQMIRAKPNLLSGTIPVGELTLRGQNLKNVVLVGKQSDTLVLFHSAGVVTAASSEFKEAQLEALTRSNPTLAGQLAQASNATGQQMPGQEQSNTAATTSALDVTDYLALHLREIPITPRTIQKDKPVPLIVRRLTAEAAILGVPVEGSGGLLETLNAVSNLNIQNHYSVYGGDPQAIQIMDAKLRVDSLSEASVAVAEGEKLRLKLQFEDVLKQTNAAKMSALEVNPAAVASLSLLESGRLNETEAGYLKIAISGIGGAKDIEIKNWLENLVQEKAGLSSTNWSNKRGGIAGVVSKIQSDTTWSLIREVARRDQFGAAEGSSRLLEDAAAGTNLSGNELKKLYTTLDADTLIAVAKVIQNPDASTNIIAVLQKAGFTAEQLDGQSLESFAAELVQWNQKARGGLAGAIDESKEVLGMHMADIFVSRVGLKRHAEQLLEHLREEDPQVESPPFIE